MIRLFTSLRKNYMIMDVEKVNKTVFNWDAKIFEHVKGNNL